MAETPKTVHVDVVAQLPTTSPELVAQFLNALGDQAWQIAAEHGWDDRPRTFGDDIALIMSELGEAVDAYREFGDTEEYSKLPGGAVVQDVVPGTKPVGVPSELVDAIVRLLHTARKRGIDIGAEYVRKTAYNETRPYRHGKGNDPM